MLEGVANCVATIYFRATSSSPIRANIAPPPIPSGPVFQNAAIPPSPIKSRPAALFQVIADPKPESEKRDGWSRFQKRFSPRRQARQDPTENFVQRGSRQQDWRRYG